MSKESAIHVDFEFGSAQIFKNAVVMKMDEGVTVSVEHNKYLVDIKKKYFKNRPFGYISHRVHSYSVNPQVYKESSKIATLIGFAMVSRKKIHITNSEVEQLFLNKPLKVFDNLDDAIKWIDDLIANSPKCAN